MHSGFLSPAPQKKIDFVLSEGHLHAINFWACVILFQTNISVNTLELTE